MADPNEIAALKASLRGTLATADALHAIQGVVEGLDPHADIDRAAEAITSGGGQILHGPMEIPGGEYALNGIDPQGATFGLVGPRKQ